MNNPADVTIAGHPFASIGMGDQMRSGIKALQAAHIPVNAFDVFRYASRTDQDHHNLIDPIETTKLDGKIRVFHINGNEIDPVLAHLAAAGHDFNNGYNIVVPAWELPNYPGEWLKQVEKFDEVWAISKFVQGIFARSGLTAHHVSQNIEVPIRPLLPRSYFGIRESAFVLLNFFDLTSYSQRKNPEAAVTLFKRLQKSRPFADLQLVLKVKDGDKNADDWAAAGVEHSSDVLILRKAYSTYETHSLIGACNCLVSLHRSEGFGRGTGEAMFLGRLAMATGWSGNVDYMTAQNSLLVNYSLIPTKSDDYPFAEGQHWAEPDIDHAEFLMTRAIDDQVFARKLASRGRHDVIRTVSARPVGLAMASRLKEILHSKLTESKPMRRRESQRATENQAKRRSGA
ncbi:glycosyltransferase [Bradyrhizobium guangzhouense]|uniref:glycosyltransferase n=1 Tax=Bradyrhizobium guangzhouense TaxID=1325095 RepID=UPI0010098EA3|nr:glycosyltransferase [Bradyrhizobium guangzhouense]RXH06468.1 glycosyltransferase family 1 protein [Bradyrhizobium guangzhouense]